MIEASGTQVLAIGLAAVLGVIAVQLFLIMYFKVRRTRSDIIEAAVRDALTEQFITMIESDAHVSTQGVRVHVGQTYFDVPPPKGLAGRATRETLISLIATISGEGRARLIAVLESAGYVARVLQSLGARDRITRVRACMVLGGMMSHTAVPQLTQRFLNDTDANVRLTAAEALGEIGDPPSAAVLLQAIHNRTRWQRLRIANVLSRMGTAAVLPLQASLDWADPDLVILCLDILSDIGVLDGCTEVLALCHHPNAEIRARCAELLGIAGYLQALPQLFDMAADAQWFVRVRVVKALERLGLPDDPLLCEEYFALLTRLLHDQTWWVRQRAAEALAAAGERGYRALEATPSDASTSAMQIHDLREGRQR